MGTFHLRTGRRTLKFAILSTRRTKGERSFLVKIVSVFNCKSAIMLANNDVNCYNVPEVVLAPCRHAKSSIIDNKYHYFRS